MPSHVETNWRLKTVFAPQLLQRSWVLMRNGIVINDSCKLDVLTGICPGDARAGFQHRMFFLWSEMEISSMWRWLYLSPPFDHICVLFRAEQHLCCNRTCETLKKKTSECGPGYNIKGNVKWRAFVPSFTNEIVTHISFHPVLRWLSFPRANFA